MTPLAQQNTISTSSYTIAFFLRLIIVLMGFACVLIPLFVAKADKF